jgi:hypothetical protein
VHELPCPHKPDARNGCERAVIQQSEMFSLDKKPKTRGFFLWKIDQKRLL